MINRFKRKVGLDRFKHIFKQLVEKLVGGSVIMGPSLVIDATGMEAQSSDPDAAGVSFEGYERIRPKIEITFSYLKRTIVH